MPSLENGWIAEEFDPSVTAPSTALAEALATVEDVDATRLYRGADLRVHDHVESDALDRLLAGADEPVTVSLSVDGYPVRIRSTGVVEIDPDPDE